MRFPCLTSSSTPRPSAFARAIPFPASRIPPPRRARHRRALPARGAPSSPAPRTPPGRRVVDGQTLLLLQAAGQATLFTGARRVPRDLLDRLAPRLRESFTVRGRLASSRRWKVSVKSDRPDPNLPARRPGAALRRGRAAPPGRGRRRRACLQDGRPARGHPARPRLRGPVRRRHRRGRRARSTASSTARAARSRCGPTSRRWRRASSRRASARSPSPVSLFYRGRRRARRGDRRRAARASSRRSGRSATATRGSRRTSEMLALLLACLGDGFRPRASGSRSAGRDCSNGDRGRGAGPGPGRRAAPRAVMRRARERRRVRSSRAAPAARRARRAPAAEEIAGGPARGFDPARLCSGRPRSRRGRGARAGRRRRANARARALRSSSISPPRPEAPYYTGLTFAWTPRAVPGALAGGGRYDAPPRALRRRRRRRSASASASRRSASAAAAPARTAAPPAPHRGGEGAPPRRRRSPRSAPEARRSASPTAGASSFRSADGAFELLLLKDDDVPTYVAHGGADLGVVGSDRVAESPARTSSRPWSCRSGSAGCRSSGGRARRSGRTAQPVRVGTKYRRLAARYFDERKIAHEIVPLAGSVELAAALELTDVVVDLIETGSTIAANGLAEIETIVAEPRDAHPRARRARRAPRRRSRRSSDGCARRRGRACMMKIVDATTRAGKRSWRLCCDLAARRARLRDAEAGPADRGETFFEKGSRRSGST